MRPSKTPPPFTPSVKEELSVVNTSRSAFSLTHIIHSKCPSAHNRATTSPLPCPNIVNFTTLAGTCIYSAKLGETIGVTQAKASRIKPSFRHHQRLDFCEKSRSRFTSIDKLDLRPQSDALIKLFIFRIQLVIINRTF